MAAVLVLTVVVLLVLLLVVEVEDEVVVEGVVAVQESVVQTCWPTELQTQVLQSTVVREPGVQPPDWVVVTGAWLVVLVVLVVPEPEEEQEEGQVPSLPVT